MRPRFLPLPPTVAERVGAGAREGIQNAKNPPVVSEGASLFRSGEVATGYPALLVSRLAFLLVSQTVRGISYE